MPYQTPPLAANAARHFLPGAGEALPLQSLNLHLEGVIRIEGSLLRCVLRIYSPWLVLYKPLCSVSPRKDYILFSTCSPPSIQRVPWPDSSGTGGEHGRESYDTWEVNEEELPWLVDPDGTSRNDMAFRERCLTMRAVTVCQISYHRQTGFETWITSDGRAYLVQLYQEQDVRPDASETSAADDEHTQVRPSAFLNLRMCD